MKQEILVLLIDDDEDDYILTKGIFDQLADSYSLSWVNSYDKGISAILKRQFDVYLVDYRLGKGTGIDLLNEAIRSGCEQPIIMLTGNGDISIDQQAMDSGAADYLIKDRIEPSLVDRSIRYSLKQANTLKALKDSERKYKTIFEQANDPILVSDYSGRIHDINNGGLKFFGYERSEFMTLTDKDLFHNAAERERFRELLEGSGSLRDFECELVSKNGGVYYCSISSFIQMDLINFTEVYHTIIRDLSYRKGIEDQSVTLGKMAISEHIAKGLGQEIRDPLTAINLVLDELASQEEISENESVQAYLEIIKGNCDRVTGLMQNFISSTETKTLNLQRCDIAELIEESISEMEDLLVGHHIKLSLDLFRLDKKILLDKLKIKDVLRSIVKNAVEAMQQYPKLIHISGALSQDRYEISIADNGPGVDPKYQDQIFEPFFTTKKRANGLGLTHAQRVLTTHNGNLRVSNGSFVLQLSIENEISLWS